MPEEQCRVCGCTDDDCTACYLKTGEPCYWAEPDLCSACAQEIPPGYALTPSGLLAPSR